jgi:hypothetical protein
MEEDSSESRGNFSHPNAYIWARESQQRWVKRLDFSGGHRSCVFSRTFIIEVGKTFRNLFAYFNGCCLVWRFCEVSRLSSIYLFEKKKKKDALCPYRKMQNLFWDFRINRHKLMWRAQYYSFILTANGFLPGGSGTTVRHNTQITHITQNNTTIKRNTAHKTTHTQ